MDKYRVTLTAEERMALEQLVGVGKAAARKLTHARILLLADTHGENAADDDIVTALGTGLRTVARVRQRFVTQSLPAALDRKAQPPRPDKIKIRGDVEQKLVQLACSDPPQEARRILDKIEWHYTPKHGSWLNMAETEIRIMNGQCLGRRLESQTRLAEEVAAWERKRNAAGARIHWTFTLTAARRKLRKLYPSNEA